VWDHHTAVPGSSPRGGHRPGVGLLWPRAAGRPTSPVIRGEEPGVRHQGLEPEPAGQELQLDAIPRPFQIPHNCSEGCRAPLSQVGVGVSCEIGLV
jgi:hypothetical protein